jgi:arsenate reductase
MNLGALKQRVLFVCVGNACRSQMAEGFARAYGMDCLEAYSGGLSPGMAVDPRTKAVMEERGISLDRQFPKPVEEALRYGPTMIVNMSGVALPHFAAGIPSEEWTVRDPVGEAEAVHREVRDVVEGLVMQLVLRLRNRRAERGGAPRVRMGRISEK